MCGPVVPGWWVFCTCAVLAVGNQGNSAGARPAMWAKALDGQFRVWLAPSDSHFLVPGIRTVVALWELVLDWGVSPGLDLLALRLIKEP